MEFRRSTAFISAQATGGVFVTRAVGPFSAGQYVESAGWEVWTSSSTYGRVGLGLSGSPDESAANWQQSSKVIRRRERNAVGPSTWSNDHMRFRCWGPMGAQFTFPIWRWLEHGPMWAIWRLEVEGISTYDFAGWVMAAEPLGGGVVRGALPVSEVVSDGGTEGGGTGAVSGSS